MLVRPTTKLYVCIADDGEAIPDTVVTGPEFDIPLHREAMEGIALAVRGCSRVRWEDVTDNEDFWLDDGNDTYVLTDKAIDYLQTASIA